MPDPEEPSENPPKSPPNAQDAVDIAALAEVYLDLWQRNIAAWAADPRSGPPLTAVERLAGEWLAKRHHDTR